MNDFKISRRNFVKSTAAGAAGLATLGLPTMASAAGLTIGIVYVGPRDDFGWNQAHAEAAKVLGTLPDVDRGGRGKRAGDDCRVQIHGIDDQSG